MNKICLYQLYVEKCKRIHNKIEIPNYKEIKVLNKLQILLLFSPAIIFVYFIPVQIGVYFFIVGFLYANMNRFANPAREELNVDRYRRR